MNKKDDELRTLAKQRIFDLTLEMREIKKQIREMEIKHLFALSPLNMKWAAAYVQRKHLAEFVGASIEKRTRGTSADQTSIEFSPMGYSQAAWHILNPEKRMYLKDMYREAVQRGYRFSASKPCQANFSAAVVTSKHFRKDADGKYYLIDSSNKWWEKK
ncbi:MAG: hypothetical protein V1694_03055 [Candidatus Eisenbacteria bacterium]